MPRHGTGLGAGSFPAANKLLMRYEADRAYKMHMQKIQNVKHRLDVAEPKKQNHLILRLKQIQKEEERQAEIDHENKLLLNKMTHVLKYGGNIDNWNNYESRSLNFPFREKQNEDIARQNLGIARRLETVRPEVAINKWEREYQQHKYLKALWSDSVKDFGEFTPRRYQSRMSRAVKRSVDNLNDTLDDANSVDTADDRKLPKLKKRSNQRPTKSETSARPGPRKDQSRNVSKGGATKLPKIVPHRARSVGKSTNENDEAAEKSDCDSDRDNDAKHENKANTENGTAPYNAKLKLNKGHKGQQKTNKDKPQTMNKAQTGNENKTDKQKENNLNSNSQVSLLSNHFIPNDLERVKTLISEEKDRDADDEKEDDVDDNVKHEKKNEDSSKDKGKETAKDGTETKDTKVKTKDSNNAETEDAEGKTGESNHAEVEGNKQRMEQEGKDPDGKSAESDIKDENSKATESENDKMQQNKESMKAVEHTNEDGINKTDIDTEQNDTNQLGKEDSTTKRDTAANEDSTTKSDTAANNQSNGIKIKTSQTKDGSKKRTKGRKQKTKEDGISGQAKDSQEDKSDVAQLFKIAKQLGRPEDIFIRTLIKKSHKQRMTTKAKFRQKYDLDLISELKTGLGPQWEYLIDAMLQEKGVADAYAVFDALSTADMADVVELLVTRDNAGIADMKESYRKEFSISLEEDVADRTQPPVQTMLLTLQKGTRDEAPDADIEQAEKDAKALFECQDDDRWEKDGGLFMTMLTKRSYPHLQMVFTEYKTVSGGQEILKDMKKECIREYYRLLYTLVHVIGTPSSFYAERLHKHKLPSDPLLVTILVSRSEVDMPEVRKMYRKLYFVDITEDIKSKSHPTQKCLVEIASKVPPGTKKPGDTKKTYVKDGAASQQHQSSTVGKKPTPVPAKKTDPKVKGQDTGRTQDSSVVGASSTKSDSTKKTSDPKPQQNKTKQDNTASDKAQNKDSKTDSNSPTNRGTVKPYSNFNAEDDCEKINSAMTAADEKAIIAIISKRSNKQRQQLKQTYEQKYKKNLMIDLEEYLSGDMDEMVLALMTPPAEYDAYVLHEAAEGLGASEATMIGILTTRSSKELKDIKDHYQKAYKSDMEKDITRDCSDDFRTLLIALARGGRQAGTTVDVPQAQTDAKTLQENGVPGEAFTELLVHQNHLQVKATFDEYKKVAGEDIYASLAHANLGDDEEGYISIAKAVEDPVLFYTEKTHSCFTSMGTNDNSLIRLTVSRSEVDLEDIKERYMELYSRSLYDSINDQCRGDYKAMLLAVIDNTDGNKSKKPQQSQAKKDSTVNKPAEDKPLGGTVKPAKPFNPIVDSERINEALCGMGADEAVIVEILPYRTNGQRQEIKAKYQDKYSMNLQVAMETEFRGDFEEIILAMLMKPVEYDAYCLHDALAGLGTNETVLIAILSTRNGKELAAIKAKYKEVYGTDLDRDVQQDVSRGMEDMFLQILKCERQQGDTVDIQQAKDDAYKLYKEGQISIDPQDEVFKDIIARKSRAQVRATFKEYKKLTGNDIYLGIEKALIGDDEDGYLGLAKAVEDPVLFYAEALHGCFEGIGTNDKRLIRIIVSRSEIDLADIKARYMKKYKKGLAECVQAECGGDYKKMLLAILGQ